MAEKKKKSQYAKEICQVPFFSYGFEPAAEVHQAHES